MSHAESNLPSRRTIAITLVLLLSGSAGFADDSAWQPIESAETLREFISGLEAERKLPGGGTSRAVYNADGTGMLYSWGESFERTWSIESDTQVCIKAETEEDSACIEIDRNTSDPTLYRLRRLDNGRVTRFRAEAHRATADPTDTTQPPPEGGAAAPSASEMAAKLADPNAVIGTMTVNFDYIAHDGAIPGASDQSTFNASFQPSLPYPLGGGKNFFARPLFPIIIDQALPTANGFESGGVELGNIGFDTAVGFTLEGGKVAIAGIAGSLPTATDERFGADQWLLGPELAFFKVGKKGVVGIFASHLWNVAGDDSFDTSLTSGQLIYTIFLKDGWTITASPPWSYNHEAASDDALTFSLGVGVGKTAIIGGRPWKLSAQYWHFLESPRAFAASDQIRVSIGPVVSLPWGG